MANTYSLFEHRNLVVGKCIGLCDHWDQVDLGMQTAHDFNIQRLERVSGWLDEIDTSMYAVVNDVHPVDLVLGLEIGIKPLLDILNNWPPRVVIVDKIAKARCVDDCQS